MGRDITIHLEYRDKKTRKFKYGGSHQVERNYLMFDLFRGLPQYLRNICCRLRGLPGDITNCTYNSYKDFGNPTYVGWLTTSELKECLDSYKQNFNDEVEEINVLNDIKSYVVLYDYMNQYESYGEECRIVFWFDQ